MNQWYGFNTPQGVAVDSSGDVYVSKEWANRVQKFENELPLKADLYDAEGYEMTDLELAAPPVIQVWFESAEGGEPVDVTADALPAGQGDEGNQCYYDTDGQWHFNLKTSNYTSPGTYTVTLASGDDAEYLIEPTCETQFVIK